MNPTSRNYRQLSDLTCGRRVVRRSDGALGKINSTPNVGATSAWVQYDGERESVVTLISDLDWGFNTKPFKKDDRVTVNGVHGRVGHDQETEFIRIFWDEARGVEKSSAVHWTYAVRETKLEPIPAAIAELVKKAKALMTERDEKLAEYESKIAELNTAIDLLKNI